MADVPLGTFNPPVVNKFTPDLGQTDQALVGGIPLVNFISSIIGFMTTLAGLMFLIYFITAGLSWVTAGGDKGQVEKAQKQMTNAAMGLIVVIAAYGIIGIVSGVLGLDILNPIKLLKTLNPLP